MWKKILDRLKAEETVVGKFLLYIVGLGGVAFAAIGAGAEYLVGIPVDWIPDNVKMYIVWGALISGVLGKLTRKPPVN